MNRRIKSKKIVNKSESKSNQSKNKIRTSMQNKFVILVTNMLQKSEKQTNKITYREAENRKSKKRNK